MTMSFEERVKHVAANWYTPVKTQKRRRGIGKRVGRFYIKLKNRIGGQEMVDDLGM